MGNFKFNLLFSKSNLSFAMFLIIFLISGVYLLQYYQYTMAGPDLVSVISIAKLYAAGDFKNAVNGYWGPLFSWFLVPFLLFKSTPFFALYSTKILSLIIGFFTIIAIRLLSYRFEMNENIRIISLFLMVFVILYISLAPIFYPMDLLLIFFIVCYLYFIFDPEYPDKLSSGVWCGIIGALAFLTKAYAFPFFLVHFVLFNLLHYFKGLSREKRKKVLKNLFLGLVIFFIISGSWGAVISSKYGELTIGTSGKYNYELVGPDQNLEGLVVIPIYLGFMEPSNEKAVSAWEDPSYHKLTTWNNLESWKSFKYQLNIIKDNFFKTMDIISSFSYFSLIILLAYILMCIQPVKRLLSQGDVLYPLLTVVLYCAGYLYIWTELRYLMLVYILLILMGGYLLNILYKNEIFTDSRKVVLTLIFIISFLIMPLSGLDLSQYGYKDVHEGINLSTEYNLQSNIASNDDYWRSMKFSYFLNAHYYGTSKITWKDSYSDSELEKDFNTYKIDYYVVWGNSNVNSRLLSKYKEITGGKINDLKIYSIKEII